MIYLWRKKEEIEKLLRNSAGCLLLVDYDGTIVPIAKTPKQAILPQTTEKVLVDLHRKQRIILGFVSGRSLQEIKKQVGIKGIIYAGNHGMEWEIGGKQYSKLAAGGLPGKLKKRLKPLENKFPGVYIEDKGLVIAVHYRLTDPGNILPLKKHLRYIVNRYLKTHTIRLAHGKKVFELKPDIDWDKGKFISYLMKNPSVNRMQPAMVYIGDDKTDEDVFSRFSDAVTVRVGRGRSKARYYLQDVPEAIRFLGWIGELYE